MKEMRRGGSNRREEGRSYFPCLPAAEGPEESKET